MRFLPFFAVALLGSLAGPALAETVLHRPADAEPETLDPQKTTSDMTIAMTRDLFTGLITLDNHRHPIPGVAEKWEVSADGKVWTFHLRHEAKWSNGDPLTAADFVYAFRRLVDPKTAADDPSDLDQVVAAKAINAGTEKDLTKLGVVAVDPYTLRMTLTEPRATLKFLLTDPQLYPLHQVTVEKWGAEWTRPDHIVSNGPYRMVAWTPQAELVYRKNPNFYDAATVKIDEVHWVNASDQEAALRRFKGGELDYVGVPKNDLPSVKRDMPEQLHTAMVDENFFLFINMNKGVLKDDIRLREALNLAIDRNVLVKQVDPRGEDPAYSFETPRVSNYSPQYMAFKDTPMPERIERAKALLKDAGYGPDHPLKITIDYTTSDSTKTLLLALSQMVAKVGIIFDLENMEWQELVSRTNQHEFDVGYMGAGARFDDFEDALSNFCSCSGLSDFAGYANSKYDDLFRRETMEMDDAKRRALGEQAERVMADDYAFVPLEYNVRNRLVNPRLQNFPDEIHEPQTRFLSFKDSAS